jgi:hypothetical protein
MRHEPRFAGPAAPALVLAIALATGGGGCASPQPAPAGAPTPKPTPAAKPLCTIATTAPATEGPVRDRVLHAAQWYAALLPTYRWGGIVSRPLTDCTGRPFDYPYDGCGDQPQLPSTPVQRLTERDLLITTVSDTMRIAWATTDRFPTGEAQGPVALVEISGKNLLVRAIGVLRAYPEHVSLRLVNFSGGPVLVAEGEHCIDQGSAAESCERGIRLLPLVGDRFVASPIRDDRGVCLSNSFIALRGSGVAASSAERYRLETSVSIGADEIMLREQLTISPATAADKALGFVRQVRAERRVRVQGGGLVASGPALVGRWQTQAQPSARRP